MRTSPMSIRWFAWLASLPAQGQSMPAQGQAAAISAGLHSANLDALTVCAARSREDRNRLVIDAVEGLCEEHNASLREAGVPSCDARQCTDSLMFRSGEDPLPFGVDVSFRSEQGAISVLVEFKFPLGASGPRAGWSVRCRPAFDFLAWRGLLPRTYVSFDDMLNELPDCQK